MKIVEAHQVPIGNISHDIFALPCVAGADKTDDGVKYICVLDEFIMEEATIFDWICKDADGKWHVLTNNEYQQKSSQ